MRDAAVIGREDTGAYSCWGHDDNELRAARIHDMQVCSDGLHTDTECKRDSDSGGDNREGHTEC